MNKVCPKCKCENGRVVTERRPDGYTMCCECGFKGLTSKFDQSPMTFREWTLSSPMHFTPTSVGQLQVSDGPMLPSFIENYQTDQWKVRVIEKSAAEERDRALRCMQQILKANGSMTYQQFLKNLEGCGMTEDQLGELV